MLCFNWFTCCLFNDTVSSSDYIASDAAVIKMLPCLRYFEDVCLEELKKTTRSVGRDKRFQSRDSGPEAPQYEAAEPYYQVCRLLFQDVICFMFRHYSISPMHLKMRYYVSVCLLHSYENWKLAGQNKCRLLKYCCVYTITMYKFYRQRNKFLLLYQALRVSTSMDHLQVLQVLRIQLPNFNVHFYICIHIVLKRLQTRL
jgi:hypothetical protein